jgi:hypothetical protein
MTSDQAAQLIEQNSHLLDWYSQFVPLFQVSVHDVFPFLAVLLAWSVGCALGWAAT